MGINGFFKIMLFGILIISLTSFGGTFAYIGDTACSVGNTITVGVWDTQADFLEVDVSQSKLIDNKGKLQGIILEDTGSEDISVSQSKVADDENLENFYDVVPGSNGGEEIVIDRIQILWNVSESDTASVRGIAINDELLFSGSVHYGGIIDVSDITLCPEISPYQITFLFDNQVSGPFDIWFIMADGSRKNVFFDVRP